MIKTSTTLLGAGLLVAALGLPLAASAHDNDGVLSLTIGTAVGRVLDYDGLRSREIYRHHHDRGHHYSRYDRRYAPAPWFRWQHREVYRRWAPSRERFNWRHDDHGQRYRLREHHEGYRKHDDHREHRDRDHRDGRDHDGRRH